MAKTKLPAFKNEEYLDFSLPKNRIAMEKAIANVRAKFDNRYPLVIGGARINTDQFIASKNPAHPSEIIGKFAHGSAQHAQQALDTAAEAFKTWSKVPYEKRANVLFKA